MSILEVSNVSKSFGGVKANVNISMTVEKGKIFGLIGIEITIQQTDHTLTDSELEDISLKVINSVESATKGKLRS